MTVRQKWILVIVVLGLCFVWVGMQRPKASYVLPDGTTVHFVAIKQGHVVRFYEGQFWERALFAICRTNKIFKWHIAGQTFASRNIEGSLMVHIKQTMTNGVRISSSGNNVPQPPMAGLRNFGFFTEHLGLIESSGKEWNGITIRKNFNATFNPVLELSSVDYYFEFPIVSDKDLHFRLSSATAKGADSTNEFILPNPNRW
ncbi:MAG TPA: hypothetical protein VH413_12110 [Verrucomicrobiae bacterium]|jgi:hypothetical protein|nr:hypothetical protein [Verrucomicrobiae bacterium]